MAASSSTRHLQLVARTKRYPMLSEPRGPGISWDRAAETFGNFAFAIAWPPCSLARSRPRAGTLALQCISDSHLTARNSALPLRHAAAFEQMQGGDRNGSPITRGPWVAISGLAATATTIWRRSSAQGRGLLLHVRHQMRVYDAGVRLVSNVKLFLASRQYRRHAVADHSSPRSTTHRNSPTRRRSGRRRPPSVLLSIGLEEQGDIIADLEQGLAAA